MNRKHENYRFSTLKGSQGKKKKIRKLAGAGFVLKSWIFYEQQ